MDKKIGIISDINSFVNELDKMKLKGQSAYQTLLDGALKYSDSSRDQLRYINQIIAAKEREAKLNLNETIQVSRQIRNESYNSIKDEIRQKGLKGSQSRDYRESRESEIRNEYAESVRNAREEYDELKLQTQLLRMIPEAINQSAREQIVSNNNDSESLQEVISKLSLSDNPKDRLVASIIQNKLSPSENDKKQDNVGKNENLISDLFRFSYINKGLSATRSLAKTDNVYDAMGQFTDIVSSSGQGFVEMLVKGVGSIFLKGDNPLKRRIVDAVAEGLGQATGTSLGLAGDVLQRNVMTQNEYLQNSSKLRAITGKNIGVSDLSNYGIDFSQYQAIQQEAVLRFGSKNLNQNVTNVALLEKGFSISRDSLYQLADIQRNTGKNVLNTAGGVLGSGLVSDRAFFGEILGKFTELQKNFLNVSTSVSDKTTADVLKLFNNVGGEFSVNDFRSMGNINSIQNSISNPGSDAMKALSYNVLRRLNPNAGISDLRLMQQQGLQTPGYFSGLLKSLEQMGGGEDFMRLSLEGLGLSASSSKTLYDNRQAIYDGKIGQGDLTNIISGSKLSSEASQSTTQLDLNSASIKNAIVQGTTEGVVEMAERFTETIKQIFAGTTIVLKNGELVQGGQIKQNASKRP